MAYNHLNILHFSSIDYTISLLRSEKRSPDRISKGGENKEEILLTFHLGLKEQPIKTL